jgi:membrane associated rhomboid family serine protease
MNSGRKRSPLSYIPGYSNNAVLQLIIFSGVAFVVLGVSWGIIKIVYQGDDANFNQYFLSNLALPPVMVFKHHWWTIFTYGWFSFGGFWELLSNMLWLYCFGSLVQMLLGHRQIIPLFAYSLVAGGVFYLLAQLLPGEWGKIPHFAGMLGPRAGLIGMAAAAVTLTPNYRFYLTETFRIHILVVAGIFGVLMIVSSGFYLSVIIMLLGGGLMGYAYIKLLKAGYRPGAWMYDIANRAESLVTPGQNSGLRRNSKKSAETLGRMYQPKTGISQKRIDDILDKINQKGYNSLSSEEKDILMRAAKE